MNKITSIASGEGVPNDTLPYDADSAAAAFSENGEVPGSVTQEVEIKETPKDVEVPKETPVDVDVPEEIPASQPRHDEMPPPPVPPLHRKKADPQSLLEEEAI